MSASHRTPDSEFLAEIVVERIAKMWPTDKAIVVVFRPADPSDRSMLFSSASAADLVPVLRAVLDRLESGTLRMPVEAGVRWVDVEPVEDG
jgi:hypothetical protein